MRSRATLSLVGLLSLAMSTVLVTSFAAIAMDEPVYAPIDEATSASDAQPQQGVSQERSESKGKTQPSTPSGSSAEETERAPRSDENEPLGKPMLAFYFVQNLTAA